MLTLFTLFSTGDCKTCECVLGECDL